MDNLQAEQVSWLQTDARLHELETQSPSNTYTAGHYSYLHHDYAMTIPLTTPTSSIDHRSTPNPARHLPRVGHCRSASLHRLPYSSAVA